MKRSNLVEIDAVDPTAIARSRAGPHTAERWAATARFVVRVSLHPPPMPGLSRKRTHHPRGFTLIELLMVAAIIAVLIALLLLLPARRRGGCSASTTLIAPRSKHSGGVNVAMCDGPVKFVKNAIHPFTSMAISTTRGGEVVGADAF